VITPRGGTVWIPTTVARVVGRCLGPADPSR
jgi:hypothetical protein